MIDRELLGQREDFQEINKRSNEPLSLRAAVLVWILLATLGWMGIVGLALLIFG